MILPSPLHSAHPLLLPPIPRALLPHTLTRGIHVLAATFYEGPATVKNGSGCF